MSAVRVYRFIWTDSVLVHRLRSFTSVEAFDGYVGELRRLGVSVSFTSSTAAVARLAA